MSLGITAKCEECSKDFEKKRRHQRFCSLNCKREHEKKVRIAGMTNFIYVMNGKLPPCKEVCPLCGNAVTESARGSLAGRSLPEGTASQPC